MGENGGVISVTEIRSALLVQGAVAIVIVGTKWTVLDTGRLTLSICAITRATSGRGLAGEGVKSAAFL